MLLKLHASISKVESESRPEELKLQWEMQDHLLKKLSSGFKQGSKDLHNDIRRPNSRMEQESERAENKRIEEEKKQQFDAESEARNQLSHKKEAMVLSLVTLARGTAVRISKDDEELKAMGEEKFRAPWNLQASQTLVDGLKESD